MVLTFVGNIRGAFHSFEKAYEIFSEQKDFYGFLMDFSCKQKDSCQRLTGFFGVKCPSVTSNLRQTIQQFMTKIIVCNQGKKILGRQDIEQH